VVTGLQLALDMALATTVPAGRGHVYAASDYVDAWLAILDPAGWDAAQIEALKAELAAMDL
jgi:uncharacterized membrane protein